MARDENDMSGVDGATGRENAASQSARRRAIDGLAPPDASTLAKAIAEASQRIREDEAKAKDVPLPEIVRASVRCGYESIVERRNDGGSRIVERARKVTFKADETADGKEYTVPHGRPIGLKRAAFLRYASEGLVIQG